MSNTSIDEQIAWVKSVIEAYRYAERMQRDSGDESNTPIPNRKDQRRVNRARACAVLATLQGARDGAVVPLADQMMWVTEVLSILREQMEHSRLGQPLLGFCPPAVERDIDRASGVLETLRSMCVASEFGARDLASQVKQLKALIARLAWDEAMNDQEMGGCIFCNGRAPRSYWSTNDPSSHKPDCPWVEARAVLDEPVRPAEPESPQFTIADVKRDFDLVGRWRTFAKYFHPQWGYFAVSESSDLILGPCHDAKSINGAISGFHATKHQRSRGREA